MRGLRGSIHREVQYIGGVSPRKDHNEKSPRHLLTSPLRIELCGRRALPALAAEAALGGCGNAKPVQHGSPGADVRCAAWTQCTAAGGRAGWGDATYEEDDDAVSCAIQGGVPPRRRRPRRSHSTLQPCRSHTRRCWPSLRMSSRPGSWVIKRASRPQTVPHTPDHLAHTRDAPLRPCTQLRVDLCAGDHPLGDGLLDGQERLRAAARRAEVVE